jgi:UDP-N-acetylglucosamine:LPS N-acetylglucosamine transferase
MSERLLRTPRRGRLIDVVSSSVGAGHLAAARAIAAQFEEQGYTARLWDILDLIPGSLGQLIRTAYVRQVQLAPSTYRWMLRSQAGTLDWLMHQAVRPAHRRILEMVAAHPLAMISTHPLGSQALGELRARGLIDVPVVTYLTDMSVHRAWVHPSVDLHLALHELAAGDARLAGAGRIEVVRPAVRDCVTEIRSSPRSMVAARQALGLPEQGRLILVTGGSVGLGDLDRTAYEIANCRVGTPIVLCGRNRRLLRQCTANRSVIALSWSDEVPLLLTAADCVVQNAGGMMSLEALAAGVPVVTYRCIAGHGETNASVLDRAGLVPWIRSYAQLGNGISKAIALKGRSDPWSTTLAGRPNIVQAVIGDADHSLSVAAAEVANSAHTFGSPRGVIAPS